MLSGRELTDYFTTESSPPHFDTDTDTLTLTDLIPTH